MDAVRFGVIGTGRAGLIHARNLAHRVRGAALVALSDPHPEDLAKAAGECGVKTLYHDYREALNDPAVDAVAIVTPTFTHREIACAAAKAGKHVFLEKPMAVTVEECRAIIDACRVAGVRLQIGFMRRFDEGFRRAKERLVSGEMGRVMFIRSIGRGPGLPPPWIFDLTKSNGILADVNSHDFDTLRWLTGSEILRVYAEAANFKCRDAAADWPDFYDTAAVLCRFDDGTLGTIEGACPCHYGYDARVEVLCENGLLLVGSVEQQGLTEVRRNGEVVDRAVVSWRNLFQDAYVAEMEHFVECVTAGRAPAVTGDDGLRAVEAVVAANESIRTGQPVAVGGRGGAGDAPGKPGG